MTGKEAALFLLERMGRWMGPEDGPLSNKSREELLVEAWLWEQAGEPTFAAMLRGPAERSVN